MTDNTFGQIYDYICDNSRCPQLAIKDTRIIQEWIFAGYDFETVIKPAVDHCLRYGGRTVKGYAFFHEEVKKRHKTSLEARTAPKETQLDKDAARAKHLRWVRDKKLNLTTVGPQDFVWLEKYEQQHGGVTA